MFKLWREVVECFGAIFKGLVCQSSVYMTYMMIWYPKSVGEHCPELEGCNCKCWGDCSRGGTHFWDISAKSIHPRKLTWIPDMMIWKRWLFFWHFFFWYLVVKLLGCTVHQLKLPTWNQAAASGEPQEDPNSSRESKGTLPPPNAIPPQEIARPRKRLCWGIMMIMVVNDLLITQAISWGKCGVGPLDSYELLDFLGAQGSSRRA